MSKNENSFTVFYDRAREIFSYYGIINLKKCIEKKKIS